jgi:hypothetical protein
MMKVGVRFAALAFALAAMTCGTAQAAQLWYDGFSLTGDGGDYVVDTALAGQTGGSGSFFTGPWLGGADGQIVNSPSLDRVYDGTSTSALITPATGGKNATGIWDGARVARELTDTFGGLGGLPQPGTYYMGFLVNFGALADPHEGDGNGGHRAIEMYDGTYTDDNYRTLQFGYSIWSGLGDGHHLTLQVNGVNAQLSENVQFAQDRGTTHYVVLKFDMQESDFDDLTTADNDIISAYLDPVGTTEPLTPSAQVSTADFLASYMTTISKWAWQGDASHGFDELRVADAFADVANNLQPYVAQPALPPVVPEPASCVLLGFVFVGLLGVRRK